MCRITFWNVKGKDLTPLVCDLAKSTDAEILVLNENTIPIQDTLQALKSKAHPDFFIPVASTDERFHCFCRDVTLDMTEIHKGYRTSYRRLHLGSTQALLGFVHGGDMRNNDSPTRQQGAQNLAQELDFVKSDKANSRVILIGDFNMNPYESGMNLAAGLNSMMTRACVARGQRQFQGQKYDFYYNPMWGLFGDRSDGPAGTIYNTSNQGPYGWSMLDQVIIHHSMITEFQSVRIVTHAGSTLLTNARGRPDSRNASDHLPIVVTLKGAHHD